MYHSVIFDGKNTWDDWHLIPTSRPVIAQPDPITNYVDIPGVGGALDISELLSGHPIYADREGSMEFVVLHDYWKSWETTRTEIANHLANRMMKIVLEDDPSYFYQGRCEMEEYRSEKDYSRVVFSYKLEPFKRPIEIPSNLKNAVVNQSPTAVRLFPITGTIAYDSPIFEVSGASEIGMRVSLGNAWGVLYNGSNRIPEIKLGPGQNVLQFCGNGTVTINYRGGVL